MKVFGERLTELREARNLSMRALAKELNVSNLAISRWERDVQTPSLEYAKRIALYFDVSIDFLAGLED